MPYRVFMPKLGMAMEEGTILRWLKQEGEYISKGEPLLEIETDKVNMEIEAPESGYLIKIIRQEGDAVQVTSTIGFIGQKDELVVEEETHIDHGTASDARANAMHAQTADTAVGEQSAFRAKISSRVRIAATPKARKLAQARAIDLSLVKPSGRRGEILSRDLEPQEDSPKKVNATPLAARIAEGAGIDLSQVRGTGPGGRVLKSDVIDRIKSFSGQSDDGLTGESIPMSGMRRLIAERLLACHRQVPAVTLSAKADVSELLAFREQHDDVRHLRISLNDFVLKACAIALKCHLDLNVSLSASEDEIIYNRNINLGVAVAVKDGLLVPVIRDADKLSLSQISSVARDLVDRARAGKILPGELSGGTFTVSNLGMYGIVSFNPLINLPESAILGVCAVESVLVLRDGRIYERKIMGLNLTIDHRLIDGAAGALFLNTLKEILGNPLTLLSG
jgi:pyruvate dehydrogenase E2 component (dihydrolipoamide acetyltransferase)